MMVYFHELFPKEAQHETAVHIEPENASLPSSFYAFLETFCSSPECDCEQVIIQMEPQCSIEPLEFERSQMPIVVLEYTWLKPLSQDNPSLYSDAPESPWSPIGLELFRNYVTDHPDYSERLGKHYKMMREEIQCLAQGIKNWLPPTPIKKEINVRRNEPCPCDSGKKFKKCCLNKEIVSR